MRFTVLSMCLHIVGHDCVSMTNIQSAMSYGGTSPVPLATDVDLE